ATLVAPEEWKTMPALSLRIGLALAKACEDIARNWEAFLEIELKWPNDLMAGGRKLGGILCESGPEGLLVGFGINIAQTSFPGPLAATATSLALLTGAILRMEGRSGDSGAATTSASAALETAFARRDGLAEACLSRLSSIGGDRDWKSEIGERLWMRGRPTRIFTGLPEGGGSIEARILGLGDDGALLAEGLDGSMLLFHSAELGFATSVDPGRADHLS
ncbi:MAG TPA: hypothetical protein VMV44_07015, partial [Rectinemataceae bacterium]|nr:hypothetical protein [Rectinemataceae bacterium]